MPFLKRAQSQSDTKEEEVQRQASDSSSVFKDSEEKGDLKVTGIKTSLTLVVNDDEIETARRQKKKPTGTDYSKLLSSLYGIALILIGFLFPVVEALSDKWLKLEFTTVFSVYIYSVATIFLVYLQIQLLCANRHGAHHTTDKNPASPPSPLRPAPPPPPQITAERGDPDSSPTSPTTDPSDTLRKSPKQRNGSTRTACSESETAHTTDTARKRRHQAKHRSLSAMVRYSSTTNLTPKAADQEFGGGTIESPSRLTDLPPDQFGEKVEEEFEVWIDMSKLGSIFSHEGSSFYLRIGSLFFGIGHLIYACLELENSSYTRPGCTGSSHWWTYIFHLVFILVQTFFLFKNQTVHVHSLRWVARFGAAHLVATNICVWLRTLVNEIMQEFKHLAEHHDDHTSHYSNDTTTGAAPHSIINFSHHHIAARAVKEGECPYYRGILSSASIYLFPFVLEYSLIAMGTTAIIYLSIDDHTKDDVVRGLTNFFKIQAIDLSDVEKADHSNGKEDDHGHGPSVLLKSHRGLFTGFLLVVGSAVSITLFFYSLDVELNTAKAELIYLTSDIVLHSILLLAAAAATYRIHRLSFIAKPVSVDDLLLYLAMIGTLVLEISVAIAAGDAVTKGKNRSIEGLRLAGSIIAAIQTVVQVVLVMSGMRRYPSKASHLKDMPGRGLLTFLVVGNVAVWVFRTTQAKELDLQGTQSDFYGGQAWLLLMNVNLPLLLFYRFHSSVCLADVWAVAYSPLHQKVPTPPEVNREASSPGGGGDLLSSRLMQSISIPPLSRPVSERKLSRSGDGEGEEENDKVFTEEGIDNKMFTEGISHVSSVSSLASENF